MTETTRSIEVFSAGCPICETAIAEIKAAGCPACDIQVHDMTDPATEKRAGELGVNSVPAVAIDGKLASCCTGRGVDLGVLTAAGLGSDGPGPQTK